MWNYIASKIRQLLWQVSFLVLSSEFMFNIIKNQNIFDFNKNIFSYKWSNNSCACSATDVSHSACGDICGLECNQKLVAITWILCVLFSLQNKNAPACGRMHVFSSIFKWTQGNLKVDPRSQFRKNHIRDIDSYLFYIRGSFTNG